MFDVISDLLTNPAVYLSIYLYTACLTALCFLVSTTPPFGYFAFWIPFTPAIALILKEQLRKARCTFAYGHARMKQVTQETRDLALEYWIRESKKNKPLP